VSATAGWTNSGCSYDNWAAAADAYANATLGVDIDSYPYHIYVLPNANGCSFVGLAYIGASDF
jgi:Gametolysin peptidase M11